MAERNGAHWRVGLAQSAGGSLNSHCYEASGEGLPHYAQVLRDCGYTYGTHWAPHDIRVRELGSGPSRLETTATLGIRFQTVPNMPLEDGIHAVRMLLPRCWFDARLGSSALRSCLVAARPAPSRAAD